MMMMMNRSCRRSAPGSVPARSASKTTVMRIGMIARHRALCSTSATISLFYARLPLAEAKRPTGAHVCLFCGSLMLARRKRIAQHDLKGRFTAGQVGATLLVIVQVYLPNTLKRNTIDACWSHGSAGSVRVLGRPRKRCALALGGTTKFLS